MRFDDTILDDINPYPSDEVEGWSESPAGQRTLVRVLDQASDGVAAFDQPTERRRRAWMVAAAAAVVVVALGIPTAIMMRSTTTVAPGGEPATEIDGVWILDSFMVDGEFTSVDVGVNSAELPMIEIGPGISGTTGCNGFRVQGIDLIEIGGGPVDLDEVTVDASICGEEGDTGLMLTPNMFREAMRNPAGIVVSSVDDTMQWLVGSSTLLFFVRDDGETELTPAEIRQVPVWVNMVGLAQFHPVVWRDRFDRMCSEGVWNAEVALALSAEFIATDLDAGTSVRGADLGPPSLQDGAVAIWSMAVNTCRDRFPEGAIEQGPPSFSSVGTPGSS